jgi:large-conductance mechanosensitive channel
MLTFLTLTIIGSVFTFQFVSSMKFNLIDPLFEFLLPDDHFNFMSIKIRDGIELQKLEPKKITIEFGNFFKEFVKWLFVMYCLYTLKTYTDFPEGVHGLF